MGQRGTAAQDRGHLHQLSTCITLENLHKCSISLDNPQQPTTTLTNSTSSAHSITQWRGPVLGAGVPMTKNRKGRREGRDKEELYAGVRRSPKQPHLSSPPPPIEHAPECVSEPRSHRLARRLASPPIGPIESSLMQHPTRLYIKVVRHSKSLSYCDPAKATALHTWRPNASHGLSVL